MQRLLRALVCVTALGMAAPALAQDPGVWADDASWDLIVKAGKKVKDVISEKEKQVDVKGKKNVKKTGKKGASKSLGLGLQGDASDSGAGNDIYAVGGLEYASSGGEFFSYNTTSIMGGAGISMPRGRVFPFAEAMFGISRLGFGDGDSETKPAGQLGGGVVIRLGAR